ncbi:hypothetical protein KSB_67990 [Ktedonobacter robiniae]|uniref:Uncharacterized protein n=1 Tax=Ktedonobacter robiniae TaxID=2778365 RepID=A0ABQ3UZK9_9CHLR|nr:hypothetical protein KSB_67990 [Ktedonobacter robiniae]
MKLCLNRFIPYPGQRTEQMIREGVCWALEQLEDLLRDLFPCAQIQVAWIKLSMLHQCWENRDKRPWDKQIDLSKQPIPRFELFFLLECSLSQHTLAQQLCLFQAKSAQMVEEERGLLLLPDPFILHLDALLGEREQSGKSIHVSPAPACVLFIGKEVCAS